jgi:D-glycerate 3-kinase
MDDLLPILTQGDLPHLLTLELGLTPNPNLDKLAQRLAAFWQIYPQKLENPSLIPSLWHFWLPFALELEELCQKSPPPPIQGILGAQGSGKTTTCKVISSILAQGGIKTLALSLDDLYKTYTERQALQTTTPLTWRGPPGSHDVQLGIELLTQVKQGQYPLQVPQFDKSLHQGQGDRIAPKLVEEVDLLLFEGWFVGVKPCNQNFSDPLTEYSNQQLPHYLPLWAHLDRLLLLLPEDYHLSQDWRTQAEHQMKEVGKMGMTDAQVEEFVKYFWRSLPPKLFIEPVKEWADLVIEIDAERRLKKIRHNKL